jgi:hypothetical protein
MELHHILSNSVMSGVDKDLVSGLSKDPVRKEKLAGDIDNMGSLTMFFLESIL